MSSGMRQSEVFLAYKNFSFIKYPRLLIMWTNICVPPQCTHVARQVMVLARPQTYRPSTLQPCSLSGVKLVDGGEYSCPGFCRTPR